MNSNNTQNCLKKMNIRVLQSEISSAFARKPGKPWTYAEELALSELCRQGDVEEEWEELKQFARDQYFPQSVYSLLSRWNETLDRYRTKRLRDTPKPNMTPIEAQIDREARAQAAARKKWIAEQEAEFASRGIKI